MMRILFAAAGATALYAAAISPHENEKHKQWMDQAQDLKEEVRDALGANAAAQAAAAAEKLVRISRQELRFWTKAEVPEAQQLAEAFHSAARQMETAAKAGDLVRTRQAFDQLQAGCRACHDLHPEKRLNRKGAGP
jgi:cytochrome c556